MDLLQSIFTDYTLRTVTLGTGLIGLISGALGCFAFLRRQSLLGDTISHAALPGVVLAFMLTGSRAPIVLVIGAAISGWLATVLIINIVRHTRIKEDSALGLALSVFFGIGIVLLTIVNRSPNASKAGLNNFLFGQAAALVQRDVVTIAIIGLIVFGLMVFFWKELKLLTFDSEFAASLDFNTRRLELILMSMIVFAIVIGLQTVGVILMSAMIVAPAAAARQWTDKLELMVLIAAFFGALSGMTGAVISSLGTGLSTGPVIVLVMTAVAALSLLFAPARGIVWTNINMRRKGRRLRQSLVLADLYELAVAHGDPFHQHTIEALEAMRPFDGSVRYALEALVDSGFVSKTGLEWGLTQAGIDAVHAQQNKT